MSLRSVAILTLVTLAAGELTQKADVWGFDLDNPRLNCLAKKLAIPLRDTPAQNQIPPSCVKPLSGAELLKPPVVNDSSFSLAAGDVVSRSPWLPKKAVGMNEPIVTDIKIRFLNKKGETIDENGQLVAGRTRADFILAELELQPGEVFREDVLEADLRRLRRMDLFNEVRVSRSQSAAGVELVYELKESRSRSVTPSFGTDEDIGTYGALSYQDRNIDGINQAFRARLQASNQDLQYSLRFIDPYRAITPNRLGYRIEGFRQRGFSNTFNEGIDLPNGNSVREGRFGGGVALLKSFNEWDAALGLNYTRISIRDKNWNLAPVDEFGTPLSFSGTGIDDLVTVSLGLVRDERNRRSYPSEGSLLSLSMEQSLPIGLGNIFLNRLKANYLQYVPMQLVSGGAPADLPDELQEMFAFNLQAGTVIGDLPPAEAFNLGGFNSVRGYEFGDIGSGRSFVLGVMEYRFPIISPVGGVLFADFASDLGSGDTVLGEPGVLRNKPGSGFGYGFGLRVKSPLGLLRLDYGINERGESRIELTTGQRF
ncbi:BamA/TamA family outer membrane protein [Microcoleus sp. FACHB-672]|uniref:BamA/TamA family outer membrane protein n=1 Tax=Microcoleus sp. FACHB-672 TaxID=2692825 RepID=UPI0016844581|nr:BamA/TamA family outer membrane protein [Microcoleus sp. FACHB-672]MBD2041073.1 BamA/TamA family outer membrane protein [Microcoleus sp. FACHB-672]